MIKIIELVEVSPRDGLQNEAVILSTQDKVALIRQAEAAGVRRIEVASFVNPKLVPQMADAEAVVASLPPNPAATRIGLVLNMRGAERALATAVDELGIVCCASDAFGMANQGQSSQETVDTALEIMRLAHQAGRAVQVTLGVAFGCPFEGAVAPERVLSIFRQLVQGQPREIALADTIGIATPAEVTHLVGQVVQAIRPLPVRVHFHDTRGMGVANALAAVAAGAVTVDASIGGVGGCPFAPGASGNVASEAVLYAFGDRMAVDRNDVLQTAKWLMPKLGRPQPVAITPPSKSAVPTTAPAPAIAPASPGALQDLKVVEMGQLIAGPFCGQLLGDMGAEVIKIEPPGAGDPMRQWGQGAPVWWEVIARNKLSVSLNLRVAQGQALARRLIAQADVLIENFKPGTLESWNLSPERLQAENPRLVIVRMSGYGQSGPYAGRAGFGGVAEAMGGWRRIVGDPDRPPSRMGVSIGDTLTASYGCMGVLAALHYRDRSGRGQVVDASLYESVLQVMEGMIAEYTVAGVTRQRSGAILPGIAPSNVYPCQDGEYMIAANQDAVFKRLCAAMGRPELSSDPRFIDHLSRGAHQTELDDIIGAWTVQRSIEAVEAAMLAASVPAGRLFAPSDMMADPHFAAREAIVPVEHPRWPNLHMQGVFPKLSETPGRVRHIAPQTVGEHNALILGQRLGLQVSELNQLRSTGVV